jgi:hypothetical protein
VWIGNTDKRVFFIVKQIASDSSLPVPTFVTCSSCYFRRVISCEILPSKGFVAFVAMILSGSVVSQRGKVVLRILYGQPQHKAAYRWNISRRSWSTICDRSGVLLSFNSLSQAAFTTGLTSSFQIEVLELKCTTPSYEAR